MSRPIFGLDIERALRLAAVAHDGQGRRGSGVPYIQHPMAVALILDRLGFDDEVVIAGLLHDVVEDTEVSLDQIRAEFGDRVADLVADGSEVKLDADGSKRPWEDRKRDHIAAISVTSVESKAVVLADKLHNLLSIRLDLIEGRAVWDSFHADRARVIAYYRAMIAACRSDDKRMAGLAADASALLDEIEAMGENPRETGAKG